MKNYTLISCLTILALSSIESSHAASSVSQESRCRAAHKECDVILNLYGIELQECHKHVEKHYGKCAVEEIGVPSPVPTLKEVPTPEEVLPAEEIATTTDTVDTDFGGIQGKKGFRNAIEGD